MSRNPPDGQEEVPWAKKPLGSAENARIPTPHDHERLEILQARFGRRQRDLLKDMGDGWGFAATNTSCKWSMILSTASTGSGEIGLIVFKPIVEKKSSIAISSTSLRNSLMAKVPGPVRFAAVIK